MEDVREDVKESILKMKEQLTRALLGSPLTTKASPAQMPQVKEPEQRLAYKRMQQLGSKGLFQVWRRDRVILENELRVPKELKAELTLRLKWRCIIMIKCQKG